MTRAIDVDGQSPETHFHHGNLCADMDQFDAALASYDRALAIEPAFAMAHYNRGVVLKALHRPEAALASYDRALALNPALGLAHFNRGIVLSELEQSNAALTSYDEAIRVQADHAGAYCNRGIVLELLGEEEAALDSFERAIELDPAMSEACFNRGNVLRKLRRFDAALESYDRAITLDAGRAAFHYNRANLLKELRQFDRALAGYDRAIEIDADYAEAYANRGNLFCEAVQYEAAIASYDDALVRDPALHFLSGQRRHARMQICDWTDFDADVAAIAARIESGAAASPPFHWLALSGSARLQRMAAETWVREICPADPLLPSIPRWAPHEKIRIGYFSGDYHNHATMSLMAELFERHDRSNFAVTAFSFASGPHDAMRIRLEAACEVIDVSCHSDKATALLARNLEIDIAVDLKGFTQGGRPGIFALRAAPVQVSYLGYPGTMGAGCMDYLIADRTLIPAGFERHYGERVIYLPDSYQVNDAKRRIGGRAFTRPELGLPPAGVVFCCFNNSFKILPGTFDGWMRILERVEGSVLWLLDDNPRAVRNLRQAAELRHVRPERLVFAPRMPPAEHLARHRLADLFLDTLPCNAHTTASDALWAGLPVLTQIGEAYAGRVAASLLMAIGLPDLITSTQAHYEALAIELAADVKRLARLRERLAQNRLTTPLFDTRRYARHLEAAYTSIHERHRAHLPPADVHVHRAPQHPCPAS